MASAPSLSGDFLLFFIIIILFFLRFRALNFRFFFCKFSFCCFLEYPNWGFCSWNLRFLNNVCCCLLVVSLECVSICKLAKGDGSGSYDCNILSCAWKAPRVLTGFLASTAHPPQCSSSTSSYARNGRRTRTNFVSSLSILIHWFQFEKAVFMLLVAENDTFIGVKSETLLNRLSLSFVCRC